MGALGFLAIIPATVLLTISFFVLVVLKKVDTQGLKVFGQVVAVMLWLAAALVFTTGLFLAVGGPHCRMMGQRGGMGCPMMGQQWHKGDKGCMMGKQGDESDASEGEEGDMKDMKGMQGMKDMKDMKGMPGMKDKVEKK